MGSSWIVFLCFSLQMGGLINICDCMPPIVLVPGDGGSRLQAKLNKQTAPHFFCEKKTTNWFDIWLSVEELLPEVIDCFIDNMRLVYNQSQKRMTSPPGVEIKVPYFGETTGIAYLDPTVDHPGEYFATLLDALVSIGYVKGKNLRGAPFDFRYAPDSTGEYFDKLRSLIEQSSLENNGEPVLLISHSLGVPFTKYLLDRVDQTWKNKYVHSWVTIAGAWGGAAKLFRIFSSGTNLGFPDFIVNPLKLRSSLRTYESSAYLLPSEKFWAQDETIIYTATKNYSLSNLEQLYDDINFSVGKDIKNLIPPVWTDHPPNVTMYCLYGTSVPTPETFEYAEGEFPDTYPKTTFGDGDGTVNRRSLEGCLQFRKTQIQQVFAKEFPKGEHMGILGDKRLIDFVTSLVDSIDV